MQNILTILICTHNRSELLDRTITSLNTAKKPSDLKINLLIIANACTDDTTDVLTSYQKTRNNLQIPLHFDTEPKPGKSYALNKAISLIKDGYICFVDDDHRVDTDFLMAIQRSIQQYPETSIFCGQIIPDWTGKEPHWIHEQGKYKIYPLPIPHFELGTHATRITPETKLPGGGNLIVHRNVFSKIGVFSTALGPKGHNLSGSEDSDFVLRALKAGFIIQYIPEIIQYHYVDMDRLRLSYLLLKSFQRTRSLTLAHNSNNSFIPLYMWRKLFNHSIALIFSFNIKKIRFYSMRIASTAGEIIGLLESRLT